MAEHVREALQRVIDELVAYKAAPSDSTLVSLKAAIDGWLESVEAPSNVPYRVAG